MEGGRGVVGAEEKAGEQGEGKDQGSGDGGELYDGGDRRRHRSDGGEEP